MTDKEGVFKTFRSKLANLHWKLTYEKFDRKLNAEEYAVITSSILEEIFDDEVFMQDFLYSDEDFVVELTILEDRVKYHIHAIMKGNN